MRVVIKVHGVGKVERGEWGNAVAVFVCHTPDSTCAHVTMERAGSCV
jgi:hypothetical protein